MDSNITDDALSRDVYVRQRYMQSVQSNIKKFNVQLPPAQGWRIVSDVATPIHSVG